MYTYLLFFHSLIRWLVLGSLLYALYRAYTGYTAKRSFSKGDDSIRHWTATISHIQMTLGFVLYFVSPTVSYLFKDFRGAFQYPNITFFGIIHLLMMLAAVVVITIGSSMAKRKEEDQAKYKTMLIFFGIALLIIFLAIPWPFSPLASRPYLRGF